MFAKIQNKQVEVNKSSLKAEVLLFLTHNMAGISSMIPRELLVAVFATPDVLVDFG